MMKRDKNNKKHPWSLAILGTICIPIFIYLTASYGGLLKQSVLYIKVHYPVANKILLAGAFPLTIFLSFVFAYAKAEEYVCLKREKYSFKNKLKPLWYNILMSVIVVLLLCNIFSIYIYIKYIGGNPFLSWEEFINLGINRYTKNR